MKHTVVTLASLTLASTLLQGQGVVTDEPSYLVAQPGSNFVFEPILTVGDLVPLTGTSTNEEFSFTGLPDAMGIHRERATGDIILDVAHEFTSTTTTTPFPPFTGEELRGAYVSRFVLGNDASVIEGGLAHSQVRTPDGTQANPVESDTIAFTRFCSGSYAGSRQGLSTDFFFTNEESSGGTFDAAGSQAVCVVNDELVTLPDLGRLARETTLVMPRRDRFTSVISSEDGGYPSYLYQYVGVKQRRAADVIDQNGLTGGTVYVLAGVDAQEHAGSFTASGPTNAINTRWVEIPNAADLTAAELELEADAVGGFAFNRIEDIEFDPAAPTQSLFVGATGGSGPNLLGRLYEISFNRRNPAASGTMQIVYNADEIVTPGGTYVMTDDMDTADTEDDVTSPAVAGPFFTENGGAEILPDYVGGDIEAGVDFSVSVDNIAVSGNYIVIQEDRNGPAVPVFERYNRDGGLWTLDRNNNFAATYEGDFNFEFVEARDGHSEIGVGTWESSGAIVADEFFGPDTFVVNVQAHDTGVELVDGEGVGTGVFTRSARTNIPDGEGGFIPVADGDDDTEGSVRDLFNEDGQIILMRLR